jgi:hypothetical protein
MVSGVALAESGGKKTEKRPVASAVACGSAKPRYETRTMDAGVSRPQKVMFESRWRTMEDAKCVGRRSAASAGDKNKARRKRILLVLELLAAASGERRRVAVLRNLKYFRGWMQAHEAVTAASQSQLLSPLSPHTRLLQAGPNTQDALPCAHRALRAHRPGNLLRLRL